MTLPRIVTRLSIDYVYVYIISQNDFCNFLEYFLQFVFCLNVLLYNNLVFITRLFLRKLERIC